MNYEISVDNIKCGGCAATIKSKLVQLDGVNSVAVAIEQGIVSIDGEESFLDAVAAELLRLGYPETGTAEGIRAAAAKAKSFVSCAIGRIDHTIDNKQE